MAYSKNLAYNPDTADGLTDWTTSNVAVAGGQFVLGAGAASMYQVRDLSTLDFTPKGFKFEVFFTYGTSSTIQDFIYAKVTYDDATIKHIQIPMHGDTSNTSAVVAFDIDKVPSSIEIGVLKASTSGTLYVDSINYYHDDNPFTYEIAEIDKPNNSIITDAYGIHIYEGNAFEGGTRRVTLGEYDLNQFGLLIKGANAETVINEYGINPKFLDYSKNVVWNSSFEVTDNLDKPSFWNIIGDGESVSSSSFYGTRSLRLGAGALVRQTWAARTKPWWLGNPIIRVSFYTRGIQNIKVRIVDIGTWQESGGTFVGYYLLTDENGNNGTTGIGTGGGGSELTYTGSADWEDSRIVFTFDSNQYGSAPPPSSLDSVAFAIEIENIDTGDIYIDGIMAHVDFTGQWAQLYKDGPRSVSVIDIGDYWTDPAFDPEAPPVESEFEGAGGASSADQVSYDNTTTGMTAVNVQDGLDELFIYVSDGKASIAAAITDRGIIASATDTFEELAAKIMMLLKNIVRYYTDQFSLESLIEPTDSYNIDLYNSLSGLNTYNYTDNFSLESEETITDSYSIILS